MDFVFAILSFSSDRLIRGSLPFPVHFKPDIEIGLEHLQVLPLHLVLPLLLPLPPPHLLQHALPAAVPLHQFPDLPGRPLHLTVVLALVRVDVGR